YSGGLDSDLAGDNLNGPDRRGDTGQSGSERGGAQRVCGEYPGRGIEAGNQRVAQLPIHPDVRQRGRVSSLRNRTELLLRSNRQLNGAALVRRDYESIGSCTNGDRGSAFLRE